MSRGELLLTSIIIIRVMNAGIIPEKGIATTGNIHGRRAGSATEPTRCIPIFFTFTRPTGYVNGKRSNYPYGKVGQVSWTSQNGSKLGSSASSGYTGTVFEPINEYKGDFARSYFYMSVRYYTEDSGWPGSAATTGSQLKAWELAQLKQWSSQDPVSTKEINRNNAIYQIQDNRNPFIDHPEYVSAIWGPVTGTDDISAGNITIYPNPVKDVCYISDPERSFSRGSTILITTETGTPVKAEFRFEEGRVAIDAAQLHPGLYVVTVTFPGTAIYHGKFIRE